MIDSKMFLSKANEFYTVQHGKVVGSAESGEKRAKYPVSTEQGKGRTRLKMENLEYGKKTKMA